ncbi:hypothetical protein TWF696_008686 [Orbilia brochopaga]|uniref:Apple domain-containing protein n=1 Tax=Orbilia brochopaga TaxID=3140254 RepID=A0AAV9UGL5_9PEZI
MTWTQLRSIGLAAFITVIPAVAAISACNADNCLRQIARSTNSLAASAFCSTYLDTSHPLITPATKTTVVTATPTVFIVHFPARQFREPETITRKAAPYIAPNKRDVIPETPEPVITPQPRRDRVRRQATLPAFASSCVERPDIPDRLSSACTCLIGSTLETPVYTRTATQNTYTTVDVCTYTATNYLRDSWQGDFTDRYASFHEVDYPSTTDVQECCTLCFHTPNCVGYYIREDNGQCGVLQADGSSKPLPNDRLCSNGLLRIYDPEPGSRFPGPYELGMCAYLEYSDE